MSLVLWDAASGEPPPTLGMSPTSPTYPYGFTDESASLGTGTYIKLQRDDERYVQWLFFERPAWTWEQILERCEEKRIDAREDARRERRLSTYLTSCAYFASTGAWRSVYFRWGYDPTKDPEARFFQTLGWRMPRRCVGNASFVSQTFRSLEAQALATARQKSTTLKRVLLLDHKPVRVANLLIEPLNNRTMFMDVRRRAFRTLLESPELCLSGRLDARFGHVEGSVYDGLVSLLHRECVQYAELLEIGALIPDALKFGDVAYCAYAQTFKKGKPRPAAWRVFALAPEPAGSRTLVSDLDAEEEEEVRLSEDNDEVVDEIIQHGGFRAWFEAERERARRKRVRVAELEGAVRDVEGFAVKPESGEDDDYY